MVLGMSLSTFTLVHVIIILIGIGSGFIVVYGLFTGKRLDGWTAIFLLITVLTSLTGFLFPSSTYCPRTKSASSRSSWSPSRSRRATGFKSAWKRTCIVTQ